MGKLRPKDTQLAGNRNVVFDAGTTSLWGCLGTWITNTSSSIKASSQRAERGKANTQHSSAPSFMLNTLYKTFNYFSSQPQSVGVIIFIL